MAEAGPGQSVVAGQRVQLDGSASSDADGNPLTFAWAFTARPSGSLAALSNPSASQPQFTADGSMIECVEALVVNIQLPQRSICCSTVNFGGAINRSKIAHPSE